MTPRPGPSGVEVPLVGRPVVAGGDVARGEGVGDGTAECRRRWLPAGPLHLPSTAQPHLHQAPGLPPASMYIHNYNYYNHLTASFPGLPRRAGTRKVKPIWILLKQETVSGSGISWAICKSAPRCRQITTPAPHYSVFYRPDALPAAQPTASKH